MVRKNCPTQSVTGLSDWRLKHIVQLLGGGAVIAYPTEGVWGLGCSPYSLSAVCRILELKSRSWEQGLIMVAASIEQLKPFLSDLPGDLMDVLERDWPGPVTYLVPDNSYCPRWIKGRNASVALRVSSHPVIRELCRLLDSPLVSTSANLSGRMPASNVLQVRKQFPTGIDVIVPGTLGASAGVSEIRDLLSGKILRRPGS